MLCRQRGASSALGDMGGLINGHISHKVVIYMMWLRVLNYYHHPPSHHRHRVNIPPHHHHLFSWFCAHPPAGPLFAHGVNWTIFSELAAIIEIPSINHYLGLDTDSIYIVRWFYHRFVCDKAIASGTEKSAPSSTLCLSALPAHIVPPKLTHSSGRSYRGNRPFRFWSSATRRGSELLSLSITFMEWWGIPRIILLLLIPIQIFSPCVITFWWSDSGWGLQSDWGLISLHISGKCRHRKRTFKIIFRIIIRERAKIWLGK